MNILNSFSQGFQISQTHENSKALIARGLSPAGGSLLLGHGFLVFESPSLYFPLEVFSLHTDSLGRRVCVGPLLGPTRAQLRGGGNADVGLAPVSSESEMLRM